MFLLGGALLDAPFLFADGPHFDQRGAMVFSDNFSGPAMGNGLGRKPGKWEMADGAVKVSEVPEDNTPRSAGIHCRLATTRFSSFRVELDGSRMVALSLNNKGGHVCRAIVTPKGMVLQVDAPNGTSDLEAVRPATSTAAVDPGKWHKLPVEVRGPRLIAQIDDAPAITGENARLDVEKTDLGTPVGGVSAKVKGLKVWGGKVSQGCLPGTARQPSQAPAERWPVPQ